MIRLRIVRNLIRVTFPSIHSWILKGGRRGICLRFGKCYIPLDPFVDTESRIRGIRKTARRTRYIPLDPFVDTESPDEAEAGRGLRKLHSPRSIRGY